MSDLTNAGESLIADIAFGDEAKVAQWYAGLLTAVTDAEAGTVTEVSAGDYARAEFDATTPVNGRIPNATDTDFGTTASAWAPAGTPVTHVGLYNAATSGTLVAVIELTSPKTIESGDPVSFPAGDLGFTFA